MFRALLHDPSREAWLAFDTLRAECRVTNHASLANVLQTVADAVETRGLWAVGMLSYESAPAFDPSFSVHPADEFPLAWFGLFDPPKTLTSLPAVGSEILSAGDALPGEDTLSPDALTPHPAVPWHPSITVESYASAIQRIRELIARGDTYQVNFTFRLRKAFPHAPFPLFRMLASRETPPFASYLDLGTHAICSLSPELLFRLDGDVLVARPMKGTSPRGLSSDDDLLSADRLRRSPKNRAENIMIVDMVRNDMGRVARPGSVTVSRMYDIEQYQTVWQMTSTVEARTDASVPDVLAALFPPASITGAPKVRTMEIIRTLEHSPRHVYTGAIGWIAPGRSAQFSVAIRTLLVDRTRNEAEYGVGGGIVWDSDPNEEYQECLAKSAVLGRKPVDFTLLETLFWSTRDGCILLEDHLARLRSSARYFSFPFDETPIRARLAEAAHTITSNRKVRLLLARDGTVTIESAALQPLRADSAPLVRLADEPVDPRNPFLYHKTTHRAVYDRARETAGQCDDVILWNVRSEITESCIANIVVEIDGAMYTPPVSCGLLPGVFRSKALRAGSVRERVISIDDLRRATRIFLTNAVRGMYEVRLAG